VWLPRTCRRLKKDNFKDNNNRKLELEIYEDTFKDRIEKPGSKDTSIIKDAFVWAANHFFLPANIKVYCYYQQSRGFYAVKEGIEPESIILYLGPRAIKPKERDFTVGEILYYTITKPKVQREFILKASLFHELGHALHQYHNMRYYKTLVDDSKEKPDERYITDLKRLGTDVSKYAKSNPMEFVAEAFSGFCCGLEYPKAVYEALFLCGGPYLSSRPASPGKVVFSF